MITKLESSMINLMIGFFPSSFSHSFYFFSMCVCVYENAVSTGNFEQSLPFVLFPFRFPVERTNILYGKFNRKGKSTQISFFSLINE